MDGYTTIAVGAVSVLVLEGLKKLIRLLIKNPDYDFASAFYVISIPVLNFALVPVLALAGFEGYVMVTDWRGWVLTLVRVALSSLVTLVGYNQGLKPLKQYSKTL